MLDELFELYDEEEVKRQLKRQGYELLPMVRENKFKIGYERFKTLLTKHKFGETSPTGENFDAIKKRNLSIEMAAIVYMYTSYKVHDDINHQLRYRVDNLDKDIELYCRLLDSVLDKLISVNNTIVYREVPHPDRDRMEILDFYESKINSHHIESSFLSCHQGYWYDQDSGFQYQILTSNNSNGKDLSELSFDATEKEVLFKRSTKFFIEKVVRQENRIYMIEV
ncbi:MAG: ADP-ribosyltransferase [bacterium]|nr:ADP-ribosyltransferase [bacterium]